MNNPKNDDVLTMALDTLFSRWVLLSAWRKAYTCGIAKCSQEGLFVLEALQISPGLSTKGLVKVLGTNYTKMMLLMKTLESNGFIEIRREEGKRGTQVYLTELGVQHLPEFRSFHAGLTSHMMTGTFKSTFGQLTDEEVAQLLSATELLLNRQVKIIEESVFQPAPIISPFC